MHLSVHTNIGWLPSGLNSAKYGRPAADVFTCIYIHMGVGSSLRVHLYHFLWIRDSSAIVITEVR